MIVAIQGITVLMGTLGMLVLSFASREVPAPVVAIVSGCIGSLSSFLVAIPKQPTVTMPFAEQFEKAQSKKEV
jgi:hypothetical protein